MGDQATKTYKYTSNKSNTDGTEEIRLPGREPVRKGGEIELTEVEHELLKGQLNLHEVGKNTESDNSDSGNVGRAGGDK